MGCQQSVEEDVDPATQNDTIEEELTHTPPMPMGDTTEALYPANSESIRPEEANVILDMRNQELQIELDALKHAQEQRIGQEVQDRSLKMQTQLQLMQERYHGQSSDYSREIDLLHKQIKAMRTELSLTVNQNTKLETTLKKNISEEEFKLIQQQLFEYKADSNANANANGIGIGNNTININVAQIAIQTSMESANSYQSGYQSMTKTKSPNTTTAHADVNMNTNTKRTHAHNNITNLVNIDIIQQTSSSNNTDPDSSVNNNNNNNINNRARNKSTTANYNKRTHSKTLTLTSNNKHMIALSFDLQTILKENKELKNVYSQHKLEKNELEIELNMKLKVLQKEIARLQAMHESKQRMIDTFEKSHHTKDDQIHALKQQISRKSVNIIAGEIAASTTNAVPTTDGGSRRLSSVEEQHVIHKQKQTITELKSTQLSLKNTIKVMHTRHASARKSLKQEISLLKQKDPQLLEKVYRERDELKQELTRYKQKTKERELNLKLNISDLKHQQSQIQDLDNKTNAELVAIVEQFRAQNASSENNYSELMGDMQRQEKEFNEQIRDLNNIISNLRSGHGLGSSRVSRKSSMNTQPQSHQKSTVDISLTKLQKPSAHTMEKKIVSDTISLSGAVATYQTYEKMKTMGMPMKNIRNKMKLDGFADAQIEKFVAQSEKKTDDGKNNNNDGDEEKSADDPNVLLNGVDLTKHDLKKYTKMKKVGLPNISIRGKMTQDGIDAKIIATFFGEKYVGSDVDDNDSVMQPPSEKPDMKKYTRMKKVKLPDGAIRNKMNKDKIDPYWVRDFFGEPQPKVAAAKRMEPPCEKPNMKKYERMKKVKLPDGAIRNKMKTDKIDPYWMRDFFGDPQPMVGGGGGGKNGAKPKGKPMEAPCPKPDLSKFIRMKKMGLHEGPIRNQMKRDKIDPYWIRDFHDEPQPLVSKDGSVQKQKPKKRKIKALHWRKKSDCDWESTIWKNVAHTTTGFQTYFEQEMREKVLHTFAAKDKKKKSKSSDSKKKAEDTEITLIDGKRSFNMIVGLRQFAKLGLTDVKIRNALLKLDNTKLDFDALENLEKFIPTNSELSELRVFKGDRKRLGRGEQFVDVFTCSTDLKVRIQLWKFKIHFRHDIAEMDERLKIVQLALMTLQESKQLARFLEICLNMGNFVNEGTNRGNARGIKLQTIERFASLKSGDGKLNMLMFILQYIENTCPKDFVGFPFELSELITKAKRIEGKFVRDGIAQMTDSLAGIGKKIQRTNRKLHELKNQFGQSAAGLLSVFSSLKKTSTIRSTNALQRIRTARAESDISGFRTDFTQNKSKTKNKNKKNGSTKTAQFSPSVIGLNPRNSKKNIARGNPRLAHTNTMPVRSKTKNTATTSIRMSGNEIKLRNEFNLAAELGLGSPEPDPKTDSIFDNDDGYVDSGSNFGMDIISDDMLVSSKPKNKKKKKKAVYKWITLKNGQRKKMKRVKRQKKTRGLKTLESLQLQKSNPNADNDNDDNNHLATMDGATELRIKELSMVLGTKKVKFSGGGSGGGGKAENPLTAEHRDRIPADKFDSIMTGFHTLAGNKVHGLDRQYRELKEYASQTAVYFGEHDDVEWEELFEVVLKFFASVQKAMTMNETRKAQLEKERKRELRKEEKRKRMAKKGMKKKKNGNESGVQEPTNILEEIRMKTMRGTLMPSQNKLDIIGYESADGASTAKQNNKKSKKNVKFKAKNKLAGLSLGPDLFGGSDDNSNETGMLNLSAEPQEMVAEESLGIPDLETLMSEHFD